MKVKVKVLLQKKPCHEEVLVGGNHMMGEPLLLEVGEEGARASVA